MEPESSPVELEGIEAGDDGGQQNVPPQTSRGPGRSTSDTSSDAPLDDTSRLETTLAGLQRQVKQLTEAQMRRETAELHKTVTMLRQVQQTNQIRSLQDQVRRLLQTRDATPQSTPESPGKSQTGSAPDDDATTDGSATEAKQPSDSSGSSDEKPDAEKKTETPVLNGKKSDEGANQFSLQIQDAEVGDVLKMLGELSGRNILVGQGVTGTVSANLKDVTIDEALDGILRSMGYVYQKEDKFIYVMTSQQAEARKQLNRKLVTKIYRPNYVNVQDLQALVQPLLTKEIGLAVTTNPAEVGLETSAEEAGGNSLTQQDALLVQDYQEIIDEVDGVVQEMDVPPRQVVIEATILSVRLSDDMEFGVNFALLDDNGQQLITSGDGGLLSRSSGFPRTGANPESILPPAAEFLANTAGLKYGLLRGDIATFINALEDITDTNLIASPQLRVLNKQRAELIIGERLGYKTVTNNGTTSQENVNFLDVGTKLVIRPFIAQDGLVRMEVHPERSSGAINPETGVPDTQTTEVTTNVMVRNESTIVIGGLIEEQVTESSSRIPLLGAIPWLGNAFRNKSEQTARTELIVLITPRIVREPEAVARGEAARHEYKRRAEYFRNHLSPVNRNNLARMEYERARELFREGSLLRARRHAERALHHNKNSREAIRLRDRIDHAIGERTGRWFDMSWTTDGLDVPWISNESNELSVESPSRQGRMHDGTGPVLELPPEPGKRP